MNSPDLYPLFIASLLGFYGLLEFVSRFLFHHGQHRLGLTSKPSCPKAQTYARQAQHITDHHPQL